jgi:hypothetical protein
MSEAAIFVILIFGGLFLIGGGIYTISDAASSAWSERITATIVDIGEKGTQVSYLYPPGAAPDAKRTRFIKGVSGKHVGDTLDIQVRKSDPDDVRLPPPLSLGAGIAMLLIGIVWTVIVVAVLRHALSNGGRRVPRTPSRARRD